MQTAYNASASDADLTTTYWKTLGCVCVYNIIYNVYNVRALDSAHAECKSSFFLKKIKVIICQQYENRHNQYALCCIWIIWYGYYHKNVMLAIYRSHLAIQGLEF